MKSVKEFFSDFVQAEVIQFHVTQIGEVTLRCDFPVDDDVTNDEVEVNWYGKGRKLIKGKLLLSDG